MESRRSGLTDYTEHCINSVPVRTSEYPFFAKCTFTDNYLSLVTSSDEIIHSFLDGIHLVGSKQKTLVLTQLRTCV